MKYLTACKKLKLELEQEKCDGKSLTASASLAVEIVSIKIVITTHKNTRCRRILLSVLLTILVNSYRL